MGPPADMKEKLLPSIKKALRPLRPVFDRHFDRRVEDRTGLVPIVQTRPEDIFIAGYPKSGNTWMQNLIAGVVFGIDTRIAPDALIQSIVPDVHYVSHYRRFLPVMFFKTHDLPRPQHRRVIYLVRDGRDAMVSYFHHLTAVTGATPDFQNVITTGAGLFPCRWHEHVEGWIENPHGAELMTISYEALKDNAVAELARLCEFAGLKRSRETLETVAHHCSFDAMRDKEKRLGWDDGGAWPKDKPFVRRGEVGSFQDEMPQTVLDAFTILSGSALKRMGYI
jgi:hypothetical protein